MPSVPPQEFGRGLAGLLAGGLAGGLVGLLAGGLVGLLDGGLFFGLVGLLGGGLVGGLAGLLSGGLVGFLVVGGLVGGLFGLLSGGLVGFLGVGLFFGLFGGLVGVLFFGLFGGLEGHRYAWDYRHWLWWWRGRPHSLALGQALLQACVERDAARERWAEPLRRLVEAVRGESRTLQQWLAALRNPDWVEATAAGHSLVALAGEAVELLQVLLSDSNADVQGAAADLIRDIAEDTSARLAARASRLLCVRCLVRCGTHKARLSGGSTVTYYGCRACHQSREFLDWSGEVVAVLDAGMSDERRERAGVLRVNYLARGSVFDFDRVDIVQATDAEVERFAVQVGNDTDEFRRPRYRQMTCAVSSQCGLSENTMRILRSMFGEVVVKRET